MISCSELLEEYSDYRDDLLPADRVAEVRVHLDSCPSCADYHRVVDRGVRTYRELPVAEPSCDFLERLQHRIYHLEDERAGWREPAASRAPVGLVALVVLLIAGAALVPALDRGERAIELPPVAALAPGSVPADEVPLLSRDGRLRTPSPSFASLNGVTPSLLHNATFAPDALDLRPTLFTR